MMPPTSEAGMHEFGSIVLTHFPFTNLSGLRSLRRNSTGSAARRVGDRAQCRERPEGGVGLQVRLLVTPEKQVVAGKIGDAEPEF
jgi:hypothetical protein